MNYGYPGANSQIENHNVSEESFWPSFTDIMMVIVMVFLLVTVAVILNNWTLIAKLTTSIKAQEAATNLADNRQVENTTLENKLHTMQQDLRALTAQFEQKKNTLENTQIKLNDVAQALGVKQQDLNAKQQLLSAKEQSLALVEGKLSALNDKYEAEQQRLNNTNQQLSASELKLSNTDKQLLDIKQQLKGKETLIVNLDKSLQISEQRAKQQLAESNEAITRLQQRLLEQLKTSQDYVSELKSTLDKSQQTTLALLTQKNELTQQLATNETSFENTQGILLEKLALLQKGSDVKDSTLSANEITQAELKAQLDEKVAQVAALGNTLEKSQQAVKSSEGVVSKYERSLKNVETLLAAGKKKLITKDNIILELQSTQQSENSQLLSLQGEYNSLDSKYQKLLRPARSTKDKFVSSVVYRKQGNKKIIRLKETPDSAYETVSKSQLDKRLTKLKEKYKNDLYVKVVIPKDSGLSYNEAWRFAIDLQHEYDYYYNDDDNDDSGDDGSDN